MEELVHHVCVLLIGEFHVALFTPHHVDRCLRHVAAHHSAVVRRAERRVFQCQLVRRSYHSDVESLRSLSSAEPRPVGNVADEVALHLNYRVRRRHRHVYRLILPERVNHVVEHALAQQRAHRIVEDEVHLPLSVSPDCRQARVVTLLSALEYFLHLAPFVAQHYVLEVGYEHRVRHYGNLVNPRVALEHVDGVFHNHLSRHLVELFRCRHPESRADPSCQYYGDILFHMYVFFLCMNMLDILYDCLKYVCFICGESQAMPCFNLF